MVERQKVQVDEYVGQQKNARGTQDLSYIQERRRGNP